MEIPKTFIKPFSISVGIMVVGFLIGSMSKSKSQKEPTENSFGKKAVLRKDITNISSLSLLLGGIAFFVGSYFFSKSKEFWELAAIICVLVVGLKLSNDKFLDNLGIESNFYRCLFLISVLTAIYCFMNGKTEGARVYSNSGVKCVNSRLVHNLNPVFAERDSILKCLGFLGDKIILSSLDNKRITVLNQSAIDGIELIDTTIKK